MVAILIKTKHFCEDCDNGHPNKKEFQSWSQSYKDSETWYFCEECDHNRSSVKIQKHDIFVRTTMHFCEVCDHGCSPNKDSEIRHFL